MDEGGLYSATSQHDSRAEDERGQHKVKETKAIKSKKSVPEVDTKWASMEMANSTKGEHMRQLNAASLVQRRPIGDHEKERTKIKWDTEKQQVHFKESSLAAVVENGAAFSAKSIEHEKRAKSAFEMASDSLNNPPPQDCLKPITRGRLATLAQIAEDWLYLALLGIIMALLSFSMDSIITLFLNTRLWLSNEMVEHNLLVQYLAWCITPILLVTFSTGFVHLCSPTAIGSGIPEMKTILRGVVLNEYLTFRTLVAKIVGLTFTLGSGLPLGKEGPSVHMASIVATLLSKLVASFQGIYENESRTSEMLSAACAVGVAATFYAPIGGVLFSIEVTTVYFAVRNYWRGFFAACCGATVWRLLGFWIKNDESISALFKTNFSTDYPFDPIELLAFSFIGATCGLAGAAYIKFHREIVQFFRRHKRISGFLQQNRFVYPTLVTLIITSSTFPPFIGKYTASTLSTHTTIEHLFSNRTWSLGNQDLVSKDILDQWTTPDTGFHFHLVLYIIMLFWTSALASTIPTPSGVFIPVLKMGAAYGRLLGEIMASIYPNGIKYSHPAALVPGSYAVVGAAALSGAVTHTVSTSVILFEMTGQIVHIIPVILGVLIANAVCQSLQPSIYDSIIEIKKLPYLPPIASSNSVSHRILVRDFMNTNIPFVWKEKCTYADLKSLLSEHKKIMSFPLVESPSSMKLLGSIPRPDLLKLLYMHLGRERRLQEVCRRNSDTLSPAIHLLNTISSRVLGSDEPKLAASDRVEAKKESDQNAASPSLKRSESAPEATSSRPKGKVDDNSAGNRVTKSDETLAQELESRADEGYVIIEKVDSHPTEMAADATRLIVYASRPQNYGATENSNNCSHLNTVASHIEGKADPKVVCEQPKEQLLSECQKAKDDDDGSDRVGPIKSIAKLVNHYDRGSSMDEEFLNKSIQEVEGHLASAEKGPPEILVVATPKHQTSGESESRKQESSRSTPVGNELLTMNNQRWQNYHLQDYPQKSHMTTRRSHGNDKFINTSTNTNVQSVNSVPLYNIHLNSSPSLSSRPTKSILKTSSFNSTTKRNISAQSFSSGQYSMSIAGNQSFDNNSLNINDSNNRQGKNHHLADNLKLSQASYGGRINENGSSTADSSNPDFSNERRSSKLDDRRPGFTIGDGEKTMSSPDGPQSNWTAPNQQGSVRSVSKRKVRLPRLRVVDMTPDEQEQWEKEQLNAHIDISRCQIDEAPFQLVEQTSLYRVHTLFSMLGLNHAYVTSFGRLVGIVALKDIRLALERMLQEK